MVKTFSVDDSDESDVTDLRNHILSELQGRVDTPKTGVRVHTAREASDLEYLAAVRDWVPTGIHALDLAVSKGKGFPLGRVAEIFGNEGSGKTALCEFLMGLVHARGGPVHYLDYEQSYDEDHLRCYGIEPDNLIYPDLPDLESGWNYVRHVLDIMSETRAAAEKARRKNDPDVRLPPNIFIWDSLAQAVPRAELAEKDHEDSHVGLVARAMSKGFRKHLRRLSLSNSLLIFVNQIREKIGVTYGRKTDTPGGRATKFACSTRLNLFRKKVLYGGDYAVGHVATVETRKARFAYSGLTADVVISYSHGVDVDWSNFLWFKSHKFIKNAGSLGFKWVGFDDRSDAFKRRDFGEFCRQHPDVVEEARTRIFDKELARASEEASRRPDASSDSDE